MSHYPYELQEINIHQGIEVGYLRSVFLRQGFLFDYIGERYELTLGAGVRLFNHLSFDYSLIVAPEGFLKDFLQRINPGKTGATGIRHLQWRISFAYTGFGKWTKRDALWWRE